MYIGVLSDTHFYFDDCLKRFFEPVDVLWHAGDFGNIAVADEIVKFKPLVGVHGNVDGMDIRAVYPEYQAFMVEEMKVLMKHIGGFPGRYDYDAFRLIASKRPDIFVCGHSHILRIMNDKKFKMLVINPGAAGLQGLHLVRTAVRFHIDGKDIHNLEVGEWERTYKPIE